MQRWVLTVSLLLAAFAKVATAEELPPPTVSTTLNPALLSSDDLVLLAANYDFIHQSHGLVSRYLEAHRADKALLLYQTLLALEHFPSGDDAIAALAKEIFDSLLERDLVGEAYDCFTSTHALLDTPAVMRIRGTMKEDLKRKGFMESHDDLRPLFK